MAFNPANQPGNPYTLATLSPEGQKPKSRLNDARQGLELFGRLKRAAEPRLERARIIQGMRDGNPPFAGEKLRQRNEAWRSNFSTQEGPSRVDSAKTPFYHLITSADTYATCTTELSTPLVDAATATRIRSEEFHRMLEGMEDFEDEWWVLFDDMVTFNRGFFHFPEPDSWRFEHIPWNLVYFPDRTSVKRRKWNYFCIEHHWSVHELYKMSRHGNGWRGSAVTNAIRNAVPEQVLQGQRDPLAIQQALADSELYTSECSEQVHAASIYVQEFDGTWTCMIVSLEGGGTEPGSSYSPPSSQVEATNRALSASLDGVKKDWLYRREKVATRVTEILCPFFYETSNGFVNSTKSGLGSRILSIMQSMDRMACSVNDNVTLRSSVVLQPMNASSRAKTAMLQLGPISVVPDGYTVQNSTIFGDIEGSLAVRDHFARVVDTTTGTFRPAFEKPTGNPEPVGTAQLRFAQSAQLSDSAVERFYKRGDTFYYEVYERASKSNLPDSSDSFIKAAREFQKRCRDRGLTDKQIEDCDPSLIRASRTIGNGSPAMRQQSLGAIAPLALQGLLGPRGLQAWKTLFVASYLGQSGVQQLLPPEDVAQVPTRDDWDASQENADMNQGNPPVLAGWQNSVIHAISHMQAGFAAVQAVQQGADPASPFTFLGVALPHIEQHIGLAPVPFQKTLATQFTELQKGAKLVEQAAKQQMQAQAQQQQLSFDQQMKMQEMMGKLQLSQAKMEGTMALKAERQQQEMSLKAQQQSTQQQLDDNSTASSIMQQNAATASSIQTAAAKTAADITLQRRKAEAEIENQRRKAEAQAEAARNKPKTSSSK